MEELIKLMLKKLPSFSQSWETDTKTEWFRSYQGICELANMNPTLRLRMVPPTSDEPTQGTFQVADHRPKAEEEVEA